MNAKSRTKVFALPARSWLVWLAAVLLSPAIIHAQSGSTITGQVVSEEGKVMADVRISLSAPSGDRFRAISRTATTDGNGRFQFRNLPNRAYGVTAFGQKGYVPKPPPATEPASPRYYPGDNVTITLMRGGV